MSPLFLAALVPALGAALDAPVTSVTVFSDRARVTRTAKVAVAGTQRIELPPLVEGADPATVRVEAVGATVQRVEIAHVDASDLPLDEARALATSLEQLDDRLAKNARDGEAVGALADAIRRLSPTLPAGDPLKPPPRLNAAGWPQVIAFCDGWLDRLQTKTRAIGYERADLERERAEAAEKARLLGGAGRRSGWRVTPTVDGHGAATLSITYLVGAARWRPGYDLAFDPDKSVVRVSFAGEVSQETGEDWTDAALTLSTAVPATAATFPKLLAWKIGERDRFIPTPVPIAESLPPAPPSAPPPPVEREQKEALRERLLALAEGRPRRGPPPGASNGDFDRRGVADEEDKKEMPAAAEAPPPPSMMEAPAPMSMPMPAPAVAHRRERESVRPASAPVTVGLANGAEREEVATASVGLAAPPAWTPPTFAPDLPASLAGGYDLAFAALRPETVKSGKGARRVALLAESWPVSVERRLFPALAPDAYLVAEIKSPSSRVLPGGPATLAVGDDPAGVAQLKLVAPGETFTLPLGLDRALRPKRNVKLVESEKGVFSKDDVGEYTVTTEIANPYRTPVSVRVIDQIPTTGDKNVEIKLGPMSPDARIDAINGLLEWRIVLPPSGKSTVTFVYTLRRPKGWRMHQ